MVHEFEGKTEKEAIDKAIESLGLDRDEIDVEIIESKKKAFFFGSGIVKIKVHLSEDEQRDVLEPEGDVEGKVIEFLTEITRKMGFQTEVFLVSREEGRIIFEIQSEQSAVMIGRQGKTLDAFQLLANIYAGRISEKRKKIIVDVEDYRQRRERNLIRFAHNVAEQVKRSRTSRLLEAMNPFERRLVHTALNSRQNIATISEGEGLYKQIRVIYKE